MSEADKSIILTAAEVSGALAGEAVEIRRYVNMRDVGFIGAGGEGGADWNDPSCWGFLADDGVEYVLDQTIASTPHQKPMRCPLGAAGERRWVKETWAIRAKLRDLSDVEIAYRADGEAHVWRQMMRPNGALTYAGEIGDTRWRSPVHMPRWASRLVVDIAAVRCERSADGQRWEWVVVARKAAACSA